MNYGVSFSHEPQIIHVMTSDRNMLGLRNEYVMNTRSYVDSQTLPKNTRNASNPKMADGGRLDSFLNTGRDVVLPVAGWFACTEGLRCVLLVVLSSKS